MTDSHFDKIPEYSVVILCYQAGEFTRTFVNEVEENLDKLNVEYEMILVANYWENSGDETPRIANELAKNDLRIKVVAFPKEGMMGWDMISGLRACSGKLLAVIDGDGQMPPSDLVRVYNKLKEENLDFVKTYRVKREDSFQRTVLSVAYSFIFRLFFPFFYVRDVNSKPKIFTRDVYNKLNLNSFDWFLDSQIMIQTGRLRLKIGEVPTVFRQIEARRSFIKFGTIWEFIINLVKARICEFMNKSKTK